MADYDLGDSDEPRDIELTSLSAIFPEIQRVDERDPYKIWLEVPVNPSKAVAVFFPAPGDTAANAALPTIGDRIAQGPPANGGNVDSHELAHLPPVRLEISLAPTYPSEQPPEVTISTAPPWLPAAVTKRLQDDAPRLWEEMGRDIVVFTFVDHIQQAAENVFDLVDEKGGLEIDPQHKIAILDHDIKARRAQFERGTFDCGVCLDPKKGTVCHRMLDCGHVFCIECLQDFYNAAIKEGDISVVRCLSPSCAKEREQAPHSTPSKKRKKPRTFISPSELLQMKLDPEVVKRYVTLKYKTELESDKNTIYCPRSWCNGAARSKKHKKPEGLDFAEDAGESESDDDDEAEDQDGDGQQERKPKPYKPLKDLLAICEDCGFAFCSRCHMSWHGEFIRCTPRREKEELTAEEIASIEYMKLHTTPCPTCAAPAQKTHGCNHMICGRCQSHFCYLCSAWLDPGNPYQHFNEQPDGRVTSCYMRLWELENGDGDDVDHGFAGGLVNRAAAAAAVNQPALAEVIPEIEEAEENHEEEAARQAAREEEQRRNAEANGGQVGVAREGPLVLRIAGNAQPPAARRGGAQAQGPLHAGLGGRGEPQQAARRPHAHGPARRGAGGAAAAGGGGGAGRRGAANAVHGQGQNQHQGNGGHNARRNNHAAAQGPRQLNIGDAGPAGGVLDAAQQAWVRQFVRLALNDEEHLMDLSDDEEEDEPDVAHLAH